jgi:hypothetical protein
LNFVRENLDDGIINIEFIKSAENQSDIFTKNITQEIYERHVEKFLEEYIEGELMAERFSIGRVLEISFMFKPISDKDIH